MTSGDVRAAMDRAEAHMEQAIAQRNTAAMTAEAMRAIYTLAVGGGGMERGRR